MNIKQIEQIYHFLSAYPFDVVEAGIAAWRTGEMPEGMEGRVTDVQVDKSYNELSDKTKQFLKEQSEKEKIMPFCKCGKQLNLTGVCPSCAKGKEDFKSKFFCKCGYEEYFKKTAREKIAELKGGI